MPILDAFILAVVELLILCGAIIILRAILTIKTEAKRERKAAEQKEQAKGRITAGDSCVMCGTYVPEGQQICALCKTKFNRQNSEE